jgi:hypothetical protein
MTTFDKLVTTDLAALATDSRRQLPAVDDMLRAIDARRPGEHRDATPVAGFGDLALVRLAGVFAHRAARAAMGAMAVLCTLVLLVALYAPGVDPRDRWPPRATWCMRVLDQEAVSLAASVALLMLATYAIAGRLALGWFERILRGPSEDGASLAPTERRRLTGSLDRWSIILGIAGVTCVTTLLGVMAFTLGRERWEVFLNDGPELGTMFTDRLRDLTVAVASVLVAAVLLALACTHPRRARWVGVLEHRATAVMGVVIGLVTMYVGFARDAGPLSPNNDFTTPATALRTALTAAGTFAVFLVTTSVTLRRRRREDLETGDGAACEPGAASLVSLAGVFGHRIARMTGGAMAVLCAIALLVVLHNPFGDEPIHLTIIDLVDKGVPWHARWLRDGVTIAAVIGILVLAAHLIGARIAARVFERSLRTLGAGSDARARAGRLVRRVDAWSVGLGIAGVASVATLFGVVGPSIGTEFYMFFQPHGARVAHVVLQALREVSVAVPLGLVAAFAVGRACAGGSEGRRGARWVRALEHRLVVPVGLALGLVAGYSGLTVDFGVFDISYPAADQPAAAVQTALTILSTTSILLVTIGYTLRRRRHEHERIGW